MSVSLSFSSSISFGQSRIPKGEQSLVRHGVASCPQTCMNWLLTAVEYLILYISEVGVAVGGHCYVNVDAICRITGNGGVACAVDGAVEGKSGDSLVFITSMLLTLNLKRYSRFLKC